MTFALIFKLLHVLVALWFITGLLGRNLTLAQAKKTTEVHTVNSLVQLAGRFERLMVIPGSQAVLLLGLFTAWAQGWPILGFLQGGHANWLLASLLIYLTVIPLIIWVFVPRGKVFEAALKDALVQQHVTPALRAAFTDRAVAWAHRMELTAVAIVVILMVTKPF